MAVMGNKNDIYPTIIQVTDILERITCIDLCKVILTRHILRLPDSRAAEILGMKDFYNSPNMK